MKTVLVGFGTYSDTYYICHTHRCLNVQCFVPIEVHSINIRWSDICFTILSDSMAWVEMVHSESGSYLTVDISVPKQGNSLGIHFKQEFVADKYQVLYIMLLANFWNSLNRFFCKK